MKTHNLASIFALVLVSACERSQESLPVAPPITTSNTVIENAPALTVVKEVKVEKQDSFETLSPSVPVPISSWHEEPAPPPPPPPLEIPVYEGPATPGSCGNRLLDQVTQLNPNPSDHTIIFEECEDGNIEDGDGCSSVCIKEFCGNMMVEEGEECDLGTDASTGNGATGAKCDKNCQFSICGDGIVSSLEACDDGNNKLCDGCNKECQIEKPCDVCPPTT